MSSCTFITATSADLDAAWNLYVDVCEHQVLDAYSPLWTLGVYPTKQDIADHVAANDLFLLLEDGKPVASMVLTPHEDPEYLTIPWPSGVTGEDACVIHLLAVHPNQRGRGLSRELVQEAIRIARGWGKKAIHLDVVPENLAASRIYLAAGFKYVGRREIFYEDTGLMEFDMYELEL